mgnify:CR=1 FL=1
MALLVPASGGGDKVPDAGGGDRDPEDDPELLEASEARLEERSGLLASSAAHLELQRGVPCFMHILAPIRLRPHTPHLSAHLRMIP